MASRSEGLEVDEPPISINPYRVLAVEKTATSNEIKTAYRKLALKHHPDKVTDSEKEAAHKRFQEIAFAYAVLSDSKRRARYDATGRTSETLSVDDDGGEFNWSDFYRSQFSEAITKETLDADKARYQGSDEEKLAIIEAYLLHEGDMDGIFEEVMHSDPLEDEARFKEIIDEEIAAKRVEAYPKYASEKKAKKKKRQAAAQKEREEAEKMAKEQNLLGDLSMMIQKRQEQRQTGHDSLLARLEAKYAPKKSGKSKRPAEDEPPEEAFEKTAQRSKKRRAVDEPPEEAFQKMADKGKKSKRPKAIIEEDDEENQEQPAVGGARRRSRKSKT